MHGTQRSLSNVTFPKIFKYKFMYKFDLRNHYKFCHVWFFSYQLFLVALSYQ